MLTIDSILLEFIKSTPAELNMSKDVIANIRARIAQCRRLAAMTTDKRTEAILLQMAEEGEADVKRLEAEHAVGRTPPPTAGPVSS